MLDFYAGKKKDLNKVPLVKGQILFITDEKTFYLAIEDPKDVNNVIRVSTYPEEIVNARKLTNSNGTIIYNSLGERIDAIPYIKLMSLSTTEYVGSTFNVAENSPF